MLKPSKGKQRPAGLHTRAPSANTVNDLHFYTAYESPLFRRSVPRC